MHLAGIKEQRKRPIQREGDPENVTLSYMQCAHTVQLMWGFRSQADSTHVGPGGRGNKTLPSHTLHVHSHVHGVELEGGPISLKDSGKKELLESRTAKCP